MLSREESRKSNFKTYLQRCCPFLFKRPVTQDVAPTDYYLLEDDAKPEQVDGLTKRPEAAVRLEQKLHAALKHVQDICLFGASNLIEDIERTNGAALIQQPRYNVRGLYLRSDQKPCVEEEKFLNIYFDPDQREFFYKNNPAWYFHSVNKKKVGIMPCVYLQCRNDGLNPLDDPRFHLNKHHRCILSMAMLTIERRQGNCFDRLTLLAKYLWENNQGIHRIEIFPTTTFDHCVIAVNRSGQLSDPNTWGDAWFVDAWYKGSGIVFHASEFKQKIKEIKLFAAEQIAKLKLIHLKPSGTPYQDEKEETLDMAGFDIQPAIHLYPTYSRSPFYPVEYYYYVCNSYPINLRGSNNDISPVLRDLDSHKEKFKDCLSQIKARR